MDPLDQVKLKSVMNLSRGSPEVAIGVIDGPVDIDHPDLESCRLTKVKKNSDSPMCKELDSDACFHGTFIAGILFAKRGSSSAPAICPDCEITLRPLFSEDIKDGTQNAFPSCTPEDLSYSLMEVIDAGVRIVNLSLGFSSSYPLSYYRGLEEAYEYAYKHDVIIVAAAGNQGNMGYISFLDHPSIIPVVSCDGNNLVTSESNIGPSVGKRGLMAPGVNITSLSPNGKYTQMSGTSVSAPFVTGAIALLWSLFPKASPADVHYAIVTGSSTHKRSIIPPLLNAENSLKILKTI